MKNKSTFMLFALLAMVFSLSGCAPSPRVSNFYMARDDQGANKTATFAPTDAFYLFFDVDQIPKGTPFEARWYALNISGKDPNTPFKVMDQNFIGGSTFLWLSVSTRLYFHLTNTTDWPVGQYRVDVYMSGNKVGEVSFSVS